MRRYHLTAFLVAAILASAACSDAAAPLDPSSSAGTGPGGPFSSVAGPSREIVANSHFLAQGLVTSDGLSLPTTWTSRDPSVASVAPMGQYIGRVLGNRPGTTIITGSSGTRAITTSVTVLAPAPASAASPIVGDFSMTEVWAGGWEYVPALTLRDTTGRDASAIIGISFDIPGLLPAPGCAMLRPIGSVPLTVFHEMYGDFELSISGGPRASGAEAVAHVTLRVPGPAAMTIDVRGPIVPGDFPTTYTPANPDPLSCG